MIPSTVARPAAPHPGPGAHRLDARPVEALLAEHGPLLARLKLCYGADRATFDTEVLPLVQGYARFVHALPATADRGFSEPGGLLRLGLETAFFALQGTDAYIFSGKATISERVQLEPRWRLATFIAGLCGELHRALGPVWAVVPDGSAWPAYHGPLTDWLARQHASAYQVRWHAEGAECRGAALFALPHVVPAACLQHLAQGNAVVVPHLLASVGGVPLREHNMLDQLVRRAAALVLHRDRLARFSRGGAGHAPEHLARFLLDALRRLAVGQASWVPNRDKSRVWYGLDGLFLAWPGGAEDLLALLEADELAGMPASAAEVLDVLLAGGAAEACTAERPCWSIHPPGARAPLEAVKLTSPALLLCGLPSLAEPLNAWLVDRAQRAAAPARGTATPAMPPVPPTPAPPPADDRATPGPMADEAQLSLLPGDQDACRAGTHPADASARPTVRTPLRLPPAVRAALQEAAATPTGPDALWVEAGSVFMPLAPFERHGIQAALAVRALRDARMLAGGTGPAALGARTVDGVAVPGVRVAAAFFEGLDGAAVPGPPSVVPPGAGHTGRAT